ncbi:MAG TPA: hypothetical protein VNG51_06740 [Ktedonobacteraceae bacterium]|nr:hypothetical protein [Ktedonobacteraceae bacterium]
MDDQRQFLTESLLKAVTIANEVDEPYRNTAFPIILQWLINAHENTRSSATVSQNSDKQESSELRLPSSMSVNAFFHKANPESHSARFVCAAYYLLHTGKAEYFTQADILEIYGKLRTPKPKNSSDVMSQCIKKVYIIDGPLTPDKQKTWVITPDGEGYVEELLNGNAAVNNTSSR